MTDGNALIALILMSVLLGPIGAHASNNLQMDGTLVTEPCTLDPHGNTLTVRFGTLVKKGLYRSKRSLAIPFRVTLSECDTSLGQTVTLTFSGEESQAAGMNGYLATTGPGSAGVAIGIETQDGKPVAINKPTRVFALHDGDTEISLQAYVQVTPEALQKKSLVAGDFSATAILDAEYP